MFGRANIIFLVLLHFPVTIDHFFIIPHHFVVPRLFFLVLRHFFLVLHFFLMHHHLCLVTFDRFLLSYSCSRRYRFYYSLSSALYKFCMPFWW